MEEDKKQTNSEPQNQPAAKNETGEEIEKLKKDCADYLAGWQRAKADFINHKKEEAQRFEEMIKFSNESLIRDLIGPIDSFDLGLAALEKKGEVEKGIYMIKTQLEDVMRKYGLEKISVKPGDKFDPSVAESLGEEESDAPSQTVAEEIEVGYRLNGKIIRPVRVKLSKGQNKDK
ncbi:MAG: nucleotide exchange factor GrpE [Patescibacteria group bacterium]|nr:nucleotide exchange factor GrpE [Patescibacteria group bacterium]